MIFAAQDPAPVLFGVFLLVAVVVAIVLAVNFFNSSQRLADLNQIAKKYGGIVSPGGLFEFPNLRFQHQGRPVSLHYSAHGGKHRYYKTHLSIHCPQARFRCEIFPASIFSGMRKLIGMQDIEVGSRRFDEEFVITGNDEAAIKEMLTADAQSQIFALHRLETGHLFSTSDLYVQFTGGTLTVTKRSYISDAALLDRYIQLFLKLHDAVTNISSAGIQFVDSPQTPEMVPHCTVCGEPLASGLVSCRTCQTLHHRECWQYFGGCATYGCGGKKFAERR